MSKVKIEHKKDGSIEITTRKILRNLIRGQVGNKGLKSVYQDIYGKKACPPKQKKRRKKRLFPKSKENIGLIPILESLYSRQNKRRKKG